MPLFEYRCKKCEHKFEVLQRNCSEKPACPECGSEDVERVMSCFGMSGSSQGKSSCSTCAGGSCSTCH